MVYKGPHSEYLELIEIDSNNFEVLKEQHSNQLSIILFQSDDNSFLIDDEQYTFNSDDFVSFTETFMVEPLHVGKALMIRWNSPFYCVVGHDDELGCKGVLYYTAGYVPVAKLEDAELTALDEILSDMRGEMESSNDMKYQMLQLLLKRVILIFTKSFTEEYNPSKDSLNDWNLYREFHYQVEFNYKEKHSVQEYAELLCKSPKTLSNTFNEKYQISPIQIIHNRILLEAKRMLSYSNASISQIAYQLGYKDIQSFSRFFKTKEGLNPKEFRQRAFLNTNREIMISK